MHVAGPLWLGQLSDQEFCKDILNEVVKVGDSVEEKKLVENVLTENDMPPTYYNLDKISEKLNLPSPRKSIVIKKLVENGYRAISTHFNPKGIKSDAPIKAIEEIINKFEFNS